MSERTIRFVRIPLLWFYVFLAAILISLFSYKRIKISKLFPIEEVQIDISPKIDVGNFTNILSVLKGKSLFQAVPQSVVSKISSIGWVQDFSIRKEFPNRVKVQIKLHSPIAFVLQKNRLFLLDSSGQIHPVEKNWLEIWNGPILSFSKANYQKLWLAQDLIQIVQTLEEKLKTHAVSEIVFGSPPYLQFFLKARLEVIANADTLEEQVPRLVQLLDDPQGRFKSARRVSLLIPKKAVVSLREIN